MNEVSEYGNGQSIRMVEIDSPGGCIQRLCVVSKSIFTDFVHSLRFASFIHSVCFAGKVRRLPTSGFVVIVWLSCGYRVVGAKPRWVIERSYPSQGGGTPSGATRRRGAEPPLFHLHFSCFRIFELFCVVHSQSYNPAYKTKYRVK